MLVMVMVIMLTAAMVITTTILYCLSSVHLTLGVHQTICCVGPKNVHRVVVEVVDNYAQNIDADLYC